MSIRTLLDNIVVKTNKLTSITSYKCELSYKRELYTWRVRVVPRK